MARLEGRAVARRNEGVEAGVIVKPLERMVAVLRVCCGGWDSFTKVNGP